MKQSLIKKISYAACAAVLAGAIGATAAYAADEDTADSSENEQPVSEEKTDSSADNDTGKDETVYVLANANGSTNKIIVSDHLKNAAGNAVITEESDLRNVQNVKGDETYTESGDTRTWQAGGNDIYYQGTSNEQLPLDMRITYTLDGNEITASELLGKSGKVTVRFDYTNNVYENVTINGKSTKIYVPFAAITGVMLDNENFRNVDVTNGKTVNDGDRTFVIGTAFPGMSESLDAKNSDKIDIPDYFEITADVTDFSMTNTITIATNEVFNDIDLDLGSSETSITEDIDKLSDAMDQLMDGSDRLYDGMSELLEKSSALTDGVGALYDGAGQLNSGISDANKGAAQLYAGSDKLSAGLDQLDANSAALTAGSEQVFGSLLDIANSQLEAAGITGYTLTIDNYSQTLDRIIASLDGDSALRMAQETAMQQVTEAVEANRDTIKAEVTKAVREQVSEKVNETVKATVSEKVGEAVEAKVLAGVLATQGMTVEQYQQGIAAGVITEAVQQKIKYAVIRQLSSSQVTAQADTAIDEQLQSEEVKAQAAAALEQQMQSDEVKAIIDKTTDEKVAELIEQNYNSEEVQSKIQAGLGEAKEGIAKLNALKQQLDSYNTFYTGLAQYTDGVAQAADGAKQVKSGLGELSTGTAALADGSQKLYDGISELNGSVPALIDGITQLADGSEQLSDGCKEFNDKGISKLIDLVDGDLGSLIDRFNALSDVSERYETFTGGSGSVKFIYRTEAVEK